MEIDSKKLEQVLVTLMAERDQEATHKCTSKNKCTVCSINVKLTKSPLILDCVQQVFLNMVLLGPDPVVLLGLIQLGLRAGSALKELEQLEALHGTASTPTS